MTPLRPLLATALVLAALPLTTTGAAGQQKSEGYQFLQAVKDGKNNDVLDMLGRPGSSIVNARDLATGEGALHIVIKRGDLVYLRYLLQKGADPNLRDGKGTTPLLLAVDLGQPEMIAILAAAKANANLANSSGETPLIRAVQKRDLTMVRSLLAAHADPDQTDALAGLSARDYALRDTRTPALTKLFADVPRRSRQSGVAGPKL